MQLLCVLLGITLVAGAAQVRDIRELLPTSEAVRPWAVSDDPLVYKGDDLYKLIDGGADVYFEYGFIRAVSAEYARGCDALACTIYEMADPEAAFGVFSYSRGSGSRPVALGDGGFEADLRIVFWQDRYLAIVESFAPGDEPARALASVATVVSRNIGAHAAASLLLGRLPRRRLIAGTEKLLRGPLTVGSLLYLGGADVFQLEKPDRVLYGEYESSPAATKLFLAIYQAAEKARRVRADVRALFTPERGYRLQTEAVGRTYWMKNDRYVALRHDADSLTLVVDAPSLESVTALIGP